MTTVRSSDGTTIAYEKTGGGPALILIDAASGFREFGPMRALAAELSPSFTVYAYDRRGRGESGDTRPYAVEREIEDLGALIEAAGGSAFVYGFSSGAVLALHAAASGLAITKLALLEPPIELDGEPDTAFVASLEELIADGRPGDAAEFFNRGIGVPDEILDGNLTGWAEAVASRLPNGTHVSLEGEWHGVAPEVLAPVLTEYLAPSPG